jgi:N utilization substance protein A
MTVVAPDDQLSLAIGKGGQNVRLAAKLLKWRIDVKSETEYQAEQLEKASLLLSGGSITTPLTALEGLGPRTAELLSENGIGSIEGLSRVSVDQMISVPGIAEKSAEVLILRAKEYVEERSLTESKENTEGADSSDEQLVEEDFSGKEEEEILSKTSKDNVEEADANIEG